MTQEIHPVVKLLLARMETHPDEFVSRVSDDDDVDVSPGYFYGRWGPSVGAIREYGTEADKEALFSVFNKLHMDHQHERTMDELLNGEERRARMEREREEERKRWMKSAATPINALGKVIDK